ncbi:tripartite motif-containing protein 16-like isoform X1 [Carassius auratus]|uniref:Tripartite motif-containing protein 16-like isoform X1 n=1 Tax=Carassius auratus TaxID=7957 RepID=A0A6P6J5X0_CARAU|nr:tripartite motif-containing protein 16-like isoform X1 [Carassius auratus]
MQMADEQDSRVCSVCLQDLQETSCPRCKQNSSHETDTHLLVDVTGELQRKRCPQHHKLLEVYCRTDRQCICCLCMLDTNHKHHDMVSAATERAEKQVFYVPTFSNGSFSVAASDKSALIGRTPQALIRNITLIQKWQIIAKS